jgi:hypothetical protein
VPEKRIGDIRKAFFEFQFTREIPEPLAQPNNQVGVLTENQGDGEHGTPKRQRMNNPDIGSHSAPPRVPRGPNTHKGRQQNVEFSDAERMRQLMGKDIMPDSAEFSSKTTMNVSGPLILPSNSDVDPNPILLPFIGK